MARYLALVEQDEGTAFGVSFPDVPGCFSAADKEDDILAKAIEALELHLEDEAAPRARGAAELRSDPDVREALRAGAYLLDVPLVQSLRRSVRFNVSMDAGAVRAIDGAAKARGLTRSAFIAEAALKEVVSA